MANYDKTAESIVKSFDIRSGEVLDSLYQGALGLPGGTTSERPSSATQGDTRVNTTDGVLEWYDGSAWVTLSDANDLSEVDDKFNTDFTEKITHSITSIDLGIVVDANFVDVDTSNAAITFIVNTPGIYRIEFSFSHGFIVQDSGNNSIRTYFRLTDGTNTTKDWDSGVHVNGSATQDPIVLNPITIMAYFNYSTTGSKTVKLQKKVIVATGAVVNVLATDTSAGNRGLHMYAYRIST